MQWRQPRHTLWRQGRYVCRQSPDFQSSYLENDLPAACNNPYRKLIIIAHYHCKLLLHIMPGQHLGRYRHELGLQQPSGWSDFQNHHNIPNRLIPPRQLPDQFLPQQYAFLMGRWNSMGHKTMFLPGPVPNGHAGNYAVHRQIARSRQMTFPDPYQCQKLFGQNHHGQFQRPRYRRQACRKQVAQRLCHDPDHGYGCLSAPKWCRLDQRGQQHFHRGQPGHQAHQPRQMAQCHKPRYRCWCQSRGISHSLQISPADPRNFYSRSSPSPDLTGAHSHQHHIEALRLFDKEMHLLE